MKCDDCIELGYECYYCSLVWETEKEIERLLMNQNLPPGVTQDMIDSQLDDMDGWPPELEDGCPDCGAWSPDDETCMSCVAANEGFKARSRHRDKKTIKERVYDEDIGF